MEQTPENFLPLYPLVGTIQNYAWGKPAAKSAAAKLAPEGLCGPDEPCAEFWLGVHPNGEAKVVLNEGESDREILLGEFIGNNSQAALGAAVEKAFGARLPFLFKILSVAKALSIQAHPSKQLAEQLHVTDPEHYPDDNHKPEMALALTPLTLLYGVRSAAEIAALIDSEPACAELWSSETREQLASLDNENSSKSEVEVLRGLFTELLSASEAAVARTVSSLLNNESFCSTPHGRLLKTLVEQYGDRDCGLVVMLAMNIVTVPEGQGLFIGAGIPHAYLSGDLVECMATSDNVVRAGLTAKFKDVEVLKDLVVVETRPPRLLSGEPDSEGALRFEVPSSEFGLRQFNKGTYVMGGDSSVTPRIWCSYSAEGFVTYQQSPDDASVTVEITPGKSFFLPALATAASLDLSIESGTLYEAFVPVEKQS